MSEQIEAAADDAPEVEMETFQTYAIGTKVFYPRIERQQIAVECPDCKGKQKWMVYTGGDYKHHFDIPCPRCTRDGKTYDWLKPERIEYTLVINEATIKSIEIARGDRWGQGHDATRIKYDLGDTGRGHDDVFLSREAAEAAGEPMMAKENEREKTDWEKDRDSYTKSAGMHILQTLQARAASSTRAQKDKLEKLKEVMLEAIRSEEGPELSRAVYGTTQRITAQSLSDWLTNLLSEADIDGWTEDELHEAMCHC